MAVYTHVTSEDLNLFLKDNGYLLYVHPPGWRKPNTPRGKFVGLYKLMTQDCQLEYLSIHGIKDGQRTFRCGTRYDWYLLQKVPQYKSTIVNDELGNQLVINMSDFKWLPNYNIEVIQSLLAKNGDEKCPIIYDRTAYGADKKDRVSETENEIFKYPCIHSTPQAGVRYRYTKFNDKGHFGVSKIIFGESGIFNPVIDLQGKYAMTHGAMAIEIDNPLDADKISLALTSHKFKDFLKS